MSGAVMILGIDLQFKAESQHLVSIQGQSLTSWWRGYQVLNRVPGNALNQVDYYLEQGQIYNNDLEYKIRKRAEAKQ